MTNLWRYYDHHKIFRTSGPRVQVMEKKLRHRVLFVLFYTFIDKETTASTSKNDKHEVCEVLCLLLSVQFLSVCVCYLIFVYFRCLFRRISSVDVGKVKPAMARSVLWTSWSRFEAAPTLTSPDVTPGTTNEERFRRQAGRQHGRSMRRAGEFQCDASIAGRLGCMARRAIRWHLWRELFDRSRTRSSVGVGLVAKLRSRVASRPAGVSLDRKPTKSGRLRAARRRSNPIAGGFTSCLIRLWWVYARRVSDREKSAYIFHLPVFDVVAFLTDIKRADLLEHCAALSAPLPPLEINPYLICTASHASDMVLDFIRQLKSSKFFHID